MRRVIAVIALLLGVLALPLATPAPAGAALPAPTLSSPAEGATPKENPVLQWNALSGAHRYRIQVSTSAGFGTTVYDQVTFNTRATPPTDLALTTFFWRVQGIELNNTAGAWSSIRSFTKTAALAPTPTFPLIGEELAFPTEPAVFTWQPLAGAKTYDIEIDDDENFTTPVVTRNTTNSSFSLTQPLAIGQTYFWRVRGRTDGNNPTQFSETQSFTITWPEVPSLISPPDSNNPAIEDIVLAWTPVAGAEDYDVQVSPNGDFSGVLSVNANVKGTRYSPPTTLPNGAYFWRVRAQNSGNAIGNWSSTYQFTRAWPAPDSPPNNRVTLLTPANNSFNVQEPNFTWTPVRLASRYEVQFSTDVNFSPGTVTNCFTNHTALTPDEFCPFRPGPGTVYYWRVRPIDDPAPVLGLFSPTFQFQYVPNLPTLTSPANGTSTSMPVLAWTGNAPLINRYRVTVFDKDGTEVLEEDTFATTYVPRGLAPDGSPFRWYVQTYDPEGRLGPFPNIGASRTFTLTAPVTTFPTPNPTSAPSSGIRLPNMQWNPVTDAKDYNVFVAPEGSGVFFQLNAAKLTVNSYTHISSNISPGNWQWFVRAYADGGGVISEGSIGTFTLLSPSSTVLTAPANCPPNTACTALRDTPTLDWNTVPGATHYRVYLATDPNFTNVFNTIRTVYSTVTPRQSLLDSQAGQAIFWYARPCWGTFNLEVCGPEPATFADDPDTPVRAFRKVSSPVALVAPANNATVANDVRFDWTDYLLTNQSGPGPVTQEARQYRVQVSTTADFSNIIDTSPLVDQTEYTAFNLTYPEGPLYWRVQATDGSSNFLTFSEVRTLTKSTPAPTPLLPANNADVTGVPLMTWQPQAFVEEYEIEVYQNPSEPLGTGNRVFSAVTKEAAWAPTGTLPAGTYGWRVRKLDSDRRAGPWSAANNTQLRLFNFTGANPLLVSPANNALLTNNTLLYQWNPVQGATKYRIEVSTNPLFTAPLKESQVTVMTSWAPTADYANGTYYWRIVTLDGNNNPLATSSSRQFTKDGGSTGDFYPLPPSRILDSRQTTPFGPAQPRNLKVTGVGGVPATGASAVVVNVTVVAPSVASFLKLWPSGVAKPPVSNLNYVTGQTIPNLVMVKIGAGGNIVIENNKGTTHVIVDVVGYYSDGALPQGSRFQATAAPTRILDTRTQVPPNPFGSGQTRAVQVAGIGGVPANASAVVLNATVTGGTQASDLRVWPKGVAQPNASNLNFTPGITIANLVVVKVGADGEVNVRNQSGQVNVIFDIIGWFEEGDPPPGNRYNPIDPARIVDTRVTNVFDPLRAGGRLQAGENRLIDMSGRGGLPAADGVIKAVVINVTATGSTAPGFIKVFPGGVARPNASNLNFAAGQSIPNLVVAGVDNQGRLQVSSNVSTDVIFDVVGWYG